MIVQWKIMHFHCEFNPQAMNDITKMRNGNQMEENLGELSFKDYNPNKNNILLF